MSSLLKFLIKILTAKLDDDAVENDPPADDESEEETEDDAEPNDEIVEDDEDEEPPAKLSKGQQTIIKLRQERQEAEKKYQQARDELEAARRQPQVNQEQTREQELRKQEDAVLSNPEATDWQKYAVQSARDSRQAAQTSQNALREARDINDKATFNQFAVSQPKTFALYKDKVEKMLSDMRSKGNDAPRAELYAYIVGKDIIDGKLKTSTAKSSAAKTGGVKRGSTPGARSDVSSKDSGKLSDSEKRAKRLENVRI